MTRAKQNISIHSNGSYFDNISKAGIEFKADTKHYNSGNLLVLHLSHKDIWLDYYISKQNLISNLKSGDSLKVDNEGCTNDKGYYIVKFSNRFKEKLVEYECQGFKLSTAAINYIVYWQKEDSEIDVKIILPELRLERNKESIT